MRKYNNACLERCKTFTPLVFSCDGMKGPQAKADLKRLARVLSTKWDRQYSQVCNYVNSQMAIALIRATSTCLRGARAGPERPSGQGLDAIDWDCNLLGLQDCRDCNPRLAIFWDCNPRLAIF